MLNNVLYYSSVTLDVRDPECHSVTMGVFDVDVAFVLYENILFFTLLVNLDELQDHANSIIYGAMKSIRKTHHITDDISFAYISTCVSYPTAIECESYICSFVTINESVHPKEIEHKEFDLDLYRDIEYYFGFCIFGFLAPDVERFNMPRFLENGELYLPLRMRN